MAQTITDVPLDETWQSLNSLSGLNIGDALTITNKSNSICLLSEGVQPTTGSYQGVHITSFHENESIKIVPYGSLEIWARVSAEIGTAKLSVQRT